MLAVGSVLYPGMIKAGYDNRFALGAIMSGGTLGIIIPPSIPMIIYAFVTESSIPDLFLAGCRPRPAADGCAFHLLMVREPPHAGASAGRPRIARRTCAGASGRS
jgi:TRAP-type C4-dicarboxylate transport system permease large subunit